MDDEDLQADLDRVNICHNFKCWNMTGKSAPTTPTFCQNNYNAVISEMTYCGNCHTMVGKGTMMFGCADCGIYMKKECALSVLGNRAQLKQRFDLIDTKGDGYLDVDEMQPVMGRDVIAFFRMCDCFTGIGDGKIHIEEWCKGLLKLKEDRGWSDEAFRNGFLVNLDRKIAAAGLAPPAASAD